MLKDKAEKFILALAHIGSSIKGIVHNINSPLSAVLGRAEMLQIRLNKLKTANSDPSLNDIIDKCLIDAEVVITNCSKVNSLTSNLMQKSISCGSGERGLLNLSNLFQEEVFFMNANMEFKHNIRKDVRIEDNVFLNNAIYVDFSNTFNEIVENIINVLKDQEEKKISIKLISANDNIIMEFGDNGPGIESSIKTEILNRLNSKNGDNRTGFARIANLLSAYNPKFEIESVPGNNIIKIIIPA